MAPVGAFGGHVQHVGGIDRVASQPVGDVLAEAAAHLRLVAAAVGFAEVLQPAVRPIPHGHPHGVLVHLEALGLGEVQAAFPGVPEAVGPFSGVAILLVPAVFLRPQPPLPLQGQDQLQHVGVPLAGDHPFLDVEHERAVRLEHPQQRRPDGQEPVHVIVRVNPSVSARTGVRIGRRGDDEAYGFRRQGGQDFAAIAGQEARGGIGGCLCGFHGARPCAERREESRPSILVLHPFKSFARHLEAAPRRAGVWRRPTPPFWRPTRGWRGSSVSAGGIPSG